VPGLEANAVVVCTSGVRIRIGTDDGVLVAQLREGSRAAWDELFRRHGQAAWKVAVATTRSATLAEDVVQETFADLIRSTAGFDRSRPLRPWLLRVVANRALNVMARERRLVPLDEHAGPVVRVIEDPDDERLQTVLEAVRGLEPERRLLVALRYWADLSPSEIATVLDVAEGTVWSRLSRCVADLRSTVEGSEHG
jgi:RNA polymerase sigma-70 factor (ECF subfamily)